MHFGGASECYCSTPRELVASIGGCDTITKAELSGGILKRAWAFVFWCAVAGLVFGSIIVAALAYELAMDGVPGQFSVPNSVVAYFGQIWKFLSSPGTLQGDPKRLENLGHSLVLFLSLVAIVLPTIAITRELRLVGERIPYERFESFFAPFSRYLPFIKSSPSLFAAVDGWRQKTYKSLAVKKMAHFYCDADQLLIISGNYSWLFDTKWSSRIQQLILEKLPHNVLVVSYKTPREVADHWKKYSSYRDCKRIFAAISFVDPSHEINGSVVKTAGTSLYIYLYREAHKSFRKDSVCAFHAVREAEALVKLVEGQLRQLHDLGQNNAQAQADKAQLLNDPQYFG